MDPKRLQKYGFGVFPTGSTRFPWILSHSRGDEKSRYFYPELVPGPGIRVGVKIPRMSVTLVLSQIPGIRGVPY